MLAAALLLLLPGFSPVQDSRPASVPAPIEARLEPRAPQGRDGLRWSPKGAKVALSLRDGYLSGSFALGPKGSQPVAVRLERSQGAPHFDVLWVDLDRDGKPGERERLTATPKDQRGKWWSSFEADIPIPVPPADAGGAAATRSYPLSLWFVEDPQEPDAEPALRWSRRGWHEGQVEIGGRPAFVLIAEMQMDGVFDQRDSWALARDRQSLLAAGSRPLDGHAWLDGAAWRPLRIDPDGRSLVFERFEPGFTEEEERASNDPYAADKKATRAEHPLAFGTDLEAAKAAARKDGKRILVDFETTWCGPCKVMGQLVYTSAAVVAAAAGVVAVKLDGDDQRELVKRYSVTGYPTMLLLDAEGKELARAVGYRSVAAMVAFLKK